MPASPDSPSPGPRGFTVLFVCVGNVCRSPLGERLLVHRLAELGAADRFQVASAGVRAMAGSGMHARSAADLTRLGGDPEGFVSRQFTERMGAASGLVLALTKEIRSRILEDAPSALKRAFTVLEFAQLAQSAPRGLDPAELVRSCAARRSTAALPTYDVVDPIGQPDAVFDAVATQLDQAVTSIARSLSRTQELG